MRREVVSGSDMSYVLCKIINCCEIKVSFKFNLPFRWTICFSYQAETEPSALYKKAGREPGVQKERLPSNRV